MYSCGLVLIEMFGVFHTDMERMNTLERARQGYVPHHLIRISKDLV